MLSLAPRLGSKLHICWSLTVFLLRTKQQRRCNDVFVQLNDAQMATNEQKALNKQLGVQVMQLTNQVRFALRGDGTRVLGSVMCAIACLRH